MAAAGAAAVPSPPPSLAEVIAAALVRRGPVRAAADAVIYLHFGAMWAGSACFFPMILGRGSTVADAAAAVQRVAMVLGGLLAPFALFLYGLRVASSGTEATKSPRRSKQDVSHAPGGHCFAIVAVLLRAMVQDVVILATLICMPFVLLISIGRLMDSGSREEGRVGDLLVDVGTLGAMVIQVFVVYSNLVSRLWKLKSRDKRSPP